MTLPNLGDCFVRWATDDPAVCLLALIGSRARAADTAFAADNHSDWDFHVGAEDPQRFATAEWLSALNLKPLVYVKRGGRLSSATKVTAIFAEGDVDLVILPAADFRSLVRPTLANISSAPAQVQKAVTELSTVLQGGYRLLKGSAEFAEFYHHVATNIPGARLSDDAARVLADGFVCDYISTLRKIDRGELLAARRWLHHQLLEVNFRLLHELRLRAGLPSQPDARRLEFSLEPRVVALSADTLLTRDSLLNAAAASAVSCRELMERLLGAGWRWPDLNPLRLRTE